MHGEASHKRAPQASTLVAKVEWRGMRVPFRRRYVTAQGQAAARYSLLVSLHTQDGITGLGEAAEIETAGGAAGLRGLAALLRECAPRFLGLPLAEVPAVARATLAPVASATLENEAAAKALRFALETASYNATGKALGRPLAALLGAEPRPLAVNALIGSESPPEAARLAAEAVAQGFRSLKLKLAGHDRDLDVAILEAVRSAVGPTVKLRVDANQAWSVGEAIEAIALLQRFQLEYVEQPVAGADLLGLAQVRRSVSVPIAADEAVGSLADARLVLQAAAADVLVVKAARVGGLVESLAILRLAEERGLPAVVTSSLETGIGLAASLHLAMAGRPGGPASGLATGLLLESDLLAQPLLPVAGLLTVPRGPGLGVALDEAALARYGTDVGGAVAA
ncbi:MAG: hypothetical protein EXR60_00210 [Dehalococcoidia bacterium]|nr:hypothetical protein [Dehalococcoidia bacterium]